MDTMRIYIPTLGRPHKQITFSKLPQRWKDQTWFVVYKDEYAVFSRQNYVPENRIILVDKIGAPIARQRIVDHASTDSIRKVFMFDDDLRFVKRVDDWEYEVNAKLRQMEEADLGIALDLFNEQLEDYAVVSMSARGNNNGDPNHPYKECGRVMRAFGVRVDVLKEENIRFDKYPYWEDFHIALSLYKRGYCGYISTEYCNDGITNSDGGCSVYRNKADLRTVREEFLKEHAPFAEANEKQAESWKNADGGPQPDLKVFWVKALDYGRKQADASSGNSSGGEGNTNAEQAAPADGAEPSADNL